MQGITFKVTDRRDSSWCVYNWQRLLSIPQESSLAPSLVLATLRTKTFGGRRATGIFKGPVSQDFV
jgi:hypothetical protein